MFDLLPGSMENKYYKKTVCEACMVQSHVIACPGFAEIREGLDLENMGDLVIVFIRKVLLKR